MTANNWSQSLHIPAMIFLQITFIILYGLFTRYDPATGYSNPQGEGSESTASKMITSTYGVFQDVQVMMFIGFGFLMTFLKRYGLSAVSLNMLISVLGIQWSILVFGFLHLDDDTCPAHTNITLSVIAKEATEPVYNSNCKPSWPYINIDLMSMLNADFSIAAVLISFGAVLGHTNPIQLLIMTIIEIVLFNINEVIGRDYVGARDAGDTIFVHMFGAYFGISCSWMLYRWEASDHSKAGSDKSSDLTSMLGTIFMWMFWPSFNAGALTGTMQMRGFVNTYLSLCACCVATFTISAIVNQKKKFSMEHVQNATLAGGIAVGACCDMIITPFGSVLIGAIAGVLSTLSFKYLAPFLAEKCNLLDTCGVHNIHGVSSVFGGLLSILFAGMATTEEYDQYNMEALTDSTKSSLLQVFPRPEDPMEEVAFWGEGGWTPQKQAMRQLATMGHTLLIAAVGGVLTGLIMRCVAKTLPNPEKNDKEMLYEDEAYFDVEEESVSNSLKNSKVVGASVVTLEY